MANLVFGVNLIPNNTDEVTRSLGNSDNKWNIHVNRINGYTPVFGIKGDKETTYRVGQVNITPENIGAVNVTSIGENNGIATLDGNGKVNLTQIPIASLEDITNYLHIT